MHQSVIIIWQLAIRLHFFWPVLVFAAAAVVPAQAAGADVSGSLLIRNVTLTHQESLEESTIVSVLIKDGKLETITEDEVPVDTVDAAFDANKGVLIGDLQTGEVATFLILDGDPRENFDLLLETERYSRFAVKNGVVMRNQLRRATDYGSKRKRAQWIGYNPPRVALPNSYRDPSAWNQWKTKAVSGLFTGVIALDRTNWGKQNDASKLQVGNLNDFEGGELRAFEIGVVGTFNFARPWVYTVFAADNAFAKGYDTREDNEVTFRDVRLDIPVYKDITLAVGKQKEPISMERITSLLRLPYQERSAVSDATLVSRNVGAVLSGTGFKQRISWAGGFFNDWLDDDGSAGSNATQTIGRLTWLPYLSADEYHLLHLGIGGRYSNGKEEFRYATEPEINNAPVYVDTGLLPADNVMTYDLEVYWQSGPVWLGGEYIHTDMDAPTLNNPTFTGYHFTASWLVSGEIRGYAKRAGIFKPAPVAKSVYQNGWGAWELFTRWSTVDLTDQLVEGGEMDILSIGATWWLTQSFNISANYRYIDLDRFGLDGSSNGLNLRVVVMLP
ncbi:MAG: hypothetical protein GQ538_08755 [Xanthomonadales bacterium]|nr:hypothetical protein [Xanthomonadales bacterium]